MATYFLFSVELTHNQTGQPARHLALFSAHEEWNSEAIEREIGTFVSTNRLPKAGLVVIGLKPHRAAIQAFCRSYSGKDPHGILYRATGRETVQENAGMRIIFADEVGQLHEGEIDTDISSQMASDQQDVIRKTGCRTIFDRRGGRVRAVGTHHFEKPSGKHSMSFIRAGNVLVKGAEVAFLSLWLLPYFRRDTTRLFLDTGSIGWVASELLRLKQILTNTETHCAIDSFSSYDGLTRGGHFISGDQSPPPEFDARTLCIISATSSGDLSHVLNSRYHVPKERIVTLFYDARISSQSTQIICEPWQAVNDELKEEALEKSSPPTDCPYCKKGGQFTRISGDNFMLESNPPQPVLIGKKHSPTWLPNFQRRNFGKNIVRCYRIHPGGKIPNEVSMDIDLLTKNAPPGTKLAERFQTFLSGAVPASVRWIVHMPDPGAQHIAESVKGFCDTVACLTNEVQVMTADDFLTNVVDNKSFEQTSGALVVAAGAVATGVTLLKFSQQIRAIRNRVPVTFIVGLSRSRNPERRRDVRTSLVTKRVGPPAAFHELEQIYLADEVESEYNSWSTELHFLKSTVFDADHPWKQRCDLLESGELRKVGLTDQVFLDTPMSKTLELRPDFVFLETGIMPNQAELYFTVASVLRNLREGSAGPESELFRDKLAHPILAPANFERFDDGIVQAALLRAAKPRELDYQTDEQFSEQMREIISGLALAADKPHGEGLFEFFLALATERLRLTQKHSEQLMASLEALSKDSPTPVHKTHAFKAWVATLKKILTPTA